MKLASAALLVIVLMLAGCGGTVNSTSPTTPNVAGAPSPTPTRTPGPSPTPTATPGPTTPTGVPTPTANNTPIPNIPGMTPFPTAPFPTSGIQPTPGAVGTTPGIAPITPGTTPTTPITPTGGTTTTTPTTLPAVSGTWVATLITTTGTPALTFTTVLQLNADGSVTGTSMTFTLGSPCFGTNTTVSGQVIGNTLNLTLSSASASGASNTVQISGTLNAAANGITGTFVVTPAAGATACASEAGTITMLRQ